MHFLPMWRCLYWSTPCLHFSVRFPYPGVGEGCGAARHDGGAPPSSHGREPSYDLWLRQPDRWAVQSVREGAGGVLAETTRTAVSFDTSHCHFDQLVFGGAASPTLSLPTNNCPPHSTNAGPAGRDRPTSRPCASPMQSVSVHTAEKGRKGLPYQYGSTQL
jgi:hypothetical protein